MIGVLRYLTKRQWILVILSVTGIFAEAYFELTLPDYLASITTLVETPGSTMREILIQAAAMLGCALGSLIASAIVAYLAAKVAASLGQTLRQKVFEQTLELSKGDAERFGTASLVNRCTNDITQIQNLVAQGLNAIVKAPVMAAWAVVKIIGYSWQWSAATAIASACVIAMLVLTVVVVLPRFQRIQSLNDVVNRLVREHLQGIRPVHAYNAEAYEQKKFAAANQDIMDNNMVATKTMAVINPGMTAISSGLTLAVYWIGAFLIAAAGAAGKLTLYSQMVVFSNYAMQIIMAFMLLNMVFVMLPRAQASARRVQEVIGTTSSIVSGVGATVDESQQGTVEFRDVSFSYPDDGARALSHVSFKAKQGETIAFIGATGSGKTTLVQLVDRLFDATGGEVLIDGVPIQDFDLDDLHNRVGYIPQTAMLFKGTVKTNLQYGEAASERGDSEIEDALAIAQADFVQTLPGTIDATIEQGGRNVSGGQRQRLAIARALARRPEILVFDDSFSALDFATDRALRDALKRECAGTTRLIVAQRVSTIRDADQILVLDQGRVVGQGTHEELLESCRPYQEIVNSQMSAEEAAHV